MSHSWLAFFRWGHRWVDKLPGANGARWRRCSCGRFERHSTDENGVRTTWVFR